jgi:outer membrane protein assembly factor BamE (lipoprotein component of BamABCDE complex)
MARDILYRIAAAGILASALAACSPTVDTRGNIAETDRLSLIQPGVTTQEEVAGILGSPSSVGTFDPNVWYYIGQRTEKTAFFHPDIVERKVVVLHFDQQGVVRDVGTLDKADGQEIALVERSTPTAGKELGFFEQILGNIGRFGGGSTTRQPGAPNLPGGRGSGLP